MNTPLFAGISATDLDAASGWYSPLLRSELIAPADGTLSALDAISGRAVAVGAVVGAVDRYRLRGEPGRAEVTITGGPAPFTCSDLVLRTPLAGATRDAGCRAGRDGRDHHTVRRAVPVDVQVFPGLAATPTIASGPAEDAAPAPTPPCSARRSRASSSSPTRRGSRSSARSGWGSATGRPSGSSRDSTRGRPFEYVPRSSLGSLTEECAATDFGAGPRHPPLGAASTAESLGLIG